MPPSTKQTFYSDLYAPIEEESLEDIPSSATAPDSFYADLYEPPAITTTPGNADNSFFTDSYDTPSVTEPNSYWSDLSGAITSGYRDMKAGLASTSVMAGALSPESAADTMLESFQNRPTAPEYVQSYLDKIQAEGMDVSKAEGVVDTSLQFVDLMASTFIESVKNPKATGYTIAQSLSNSLPSLALGGAGLVSPIPGGFAVGTGLGTFAVEAGAHFNGLLQTKLAEQGKSAEQVTTEDIIGLLDSEEFTSFAESEATKAGLAVATVEAVMAATGMKIIKQGVDKAAAKGTQQTFGSQLARGSAAFALETAGEGVGEAAKQVVTEGDMNYGDIALETITGLGQSAGTTAIAQTGAQIGKAIPTRKVKDDLDDVFGEGVDDIPADPLGAMLEESTDEISSDPLGDLLNEANAEPIEDTVEPVQAPDQMAEAIAEAMSIVDQFPELQDAAAGVRANGELTEAGVALQMVRQAVDTPFAERSEGQQALVVYARGYDAKVEKETASPADEIGKALAGTQPIEQQDPLAQAVEAAEENPAVTKAVLDFIDPALLTAKDKEFLANYEVQQDGKATDPVRLDTANSNDQAATTQPELPAESIQVTPDNKGATPTTSEEITDGTNTGRSNTTEDVGERTAATSTKETTNTGRKDTSNPLPQPRGKVTQSDVLESAAPISAATTTEEEGTDGSSPLQLSGATATMDTDVARTESTQRRASETTTELRDLRGATPKGIKAKRENKARIAELEAMVKSEVDAKANEAATSPTNTQTQPTQEDLESGDYNKGRLEVQGIAIAIENPKGSTRKGVDQQGKEWSSTMKDHYGYIQRTEGADGDAVDVFIGDNPSSEKVFIVDQVDPSTGQFDEHKVVIGAKSSAQAKMFYNRNYDKGWKGAAAITEFTTDEFKTWIAQSDTTQPVNSKVKANVKQDSVSTEGETGADIQARPTVSEGSTVGATQGERTAASAQPAVETGPTGISTPVDKKLEARNRQKQVNETDSLATAISKKGGLNKDHWISQGVDPAATKRGGSGIKQVFGKPTFRAKGGMTADDVAEMARELGYGDDIDANKAVELIIGELNGTPAFTPAGAVADYSLQNEQDGQIDTKNVASTEARLPDVENPDDFSLTGSNRASDANPNQSDIFAPQPMSEPTFDDDDDSGDMFDFPAPAPVAESGANEKTPIERMTSRKDRYDEAKTPNEKLTALHSFNKSAEKYGSAEDKKFAAAEEQKFKNDGYEISPIKVGDKILDGQTILEDGRIEDPDLLEGTTLVEQVLEPQIMKDGVLHREAKVVARVGTRKANAKEQQAIDNKEAEYQKTLAKLKGNDIAKKSAPVVKSDKPATPTDDIPATPTQSTTPEPMTEGGPVETVKEVVPEASTLSDMLKKNDPADVMRYIKAHSTDDSLAAIIDKIIDLIPNNLKIKLVSDGDIAPRALQGAKGIFQLKFESGVVSNTIFLKDETFVNNGINDETVIHEILHAVTTSLFEAGRLPSNKNTELGLAVADITNLRNVIVREINLRIKSGNLVQEDNFLEIVTSSAEELISWGLTNARFQQFLKTIHVNNKTVWSKFVTAVGKALGINQDSRSALAALMSSTEVLLAADFSPSTKYLLDTQKKSSSFKHSIMDTPKLDRIALLELAVSQDDAMREDRLDMAAGKRVKDATAEITQLQEEIKERRKKDPHFDEGVSDFDKQGETFLASAPEYMTIAERMTAALKDKLEPWTDIKYIIGRMSSSVFFIEQAERLKYGQRQSAEVSPTAAMHKAANSKVAASMAIHVSGVQIVNGTIVPVEGAQGLKQILEEVSQEGTRFLRRFEQYLLLNRSRTLLEQGRENLVEQEAIDKMDAWLERNPNANALYKKQAVAFAKWNKSILQVAVDSGWINAQDAFGGFKFTADDGTEILGPESTFFETAEDAQAAGESAGLKGTTEATEGWYDEMYVPFYRVSDQVGVSGPKRGGKKPGDLGKATSKLKGGTNKIPILDNIMRNAEFLIEGSMKTIAMQQVRELFKDTLFESIPLGDELSLDISPMVDSAKIKADYADMKAQAELDGTPLPEFNDKDAQRWAKLRRFAKPTDKDAVAVFENGRATYYKITDTKLLDAVKTIGPYRASNLMKAIGLPTRILQQAITIMPAFLVRSFVREIQNAYVVNSNGGLNPLATIGKAVKNLGVIAKGNDPWMQEMMSGGFVNYNTYFKATPDKLRKELEKAGIKRSTFNTYLQSPWTGLKSLGRMYHNLAIATEHASRKTMYNDAIKSGATPEEAKYLALDMMNFGRRSDYAAMEVVLATVPFLNPRIQGMDRLLRGAKEDPKTFLLKGALMAGAATALAAWNWEFNDEEMEKLKSEDKALNYHFFIDTGDEDKIHWRIPKGFEVGQITGTLPEFAVENIKSVAPEPVSNALDRFITLTFGVQNPQILAPMLDVGFNEDSFRQRPIVSYGQQFLLPPAQFDTYTSKLVIDMAQSAPDGAPDWMRSPKKLEYLIKGYTGSLGAMVLEVIDDIYQATGNAPDAPTKKISQMYVLRDYIQTGAVKSSKQNDLFYQMTTEAAQLASTLMAKKSYDMTEYREMRAENTNKLAARSGLNKYSKLMSDISKEIKRVYESDDDPDLKAIKQDRLVKRKNKLAQDAVDKYWYIFD